MNRVNQMTQWRRVSISVSVAICVAFSLAFAIMVVAAKSASNLFDQLVLIGTGSTLLGAGVIVVLVQAFTILIVGPVVERS